MKRVMEHRAMSFRGRCSNREPLKPVETAYCFIGCSGYSGRVVRLPAGGESLAMRSVQVSLATQIHPMKQVRRFESAVLAIQPLGRANSE